MKKLFSFFATGIIYLATAFTAFALPGFTPSVKDIPGEYVYYRDTSFQRESYIGFLMYDESTYAIRYYAPEVKKENKKESSIIVYVTVNHDKPYMELTGEKVDNAKSMGYEETEIVNYMHDLLYEFNSRRIKAGSKLPVITSENFMQFGGDVQVEYDEVVPLFNIKSIVNQTQGKKVLYVATCGRLISNDDASFHNFKAFPKSYSDKHKMPNVKKASKVSASLENGPSVTIDTAWKQQMQNFWTLGDSAILTMGSIPNISSQTFIQRQLMHSKSSAYVDWNYTNCKVQDGKIIVSTLVYDTSSNKVNNNIQVVIFGDKENYLMVLSVYNNAYNKNRSYFNSIASSFSKK